MLRKFLAAGVALAIGYALGVFFGYRAAVVDYVENDAENIETMADSIYSADGEPTIPQEVVEKLEEKAEAEGETNGSEGKGFY